MMSQKALLRLYHHSFATQALFCLLLDSALNEEFKSCNIYASSLVCNALLFPFLLSLTCKAMHPSKHAEIHSALSARFIYRLRLYLLPHSVFLE